MRRQKTATNSDLAKLAYLLLHLVTLFLRYISSQRFYYLFAEIFSRQLIGSTWLDDQANKLLRWMNAERFLALKQVCAIRLKRAAMHIVSTDDNGAATTANVFPVR